MSTSWSNQPFFFSPCSVALLAPEIRNQIHIAGEYFPLTRNSNSNSESMSIWETLTCRPAKS
ncbi:MAG: hypothetical protein M3Q77_08135 [Thermoproteota archaeon]|nr:hypothetical protein [Thermoproteota archaeon]